MAEILIRQSQKGGEIIRIGHDSLIEELTINIMSITEANAEAESEANAEVSAEANTEIKSETVLEEPEIVNNL